MSAPCEDIKRKGGNVKAKIGRALSDSNAYIEGTMERIWEMIDSKDGGVPYDTIRNMILQTEAANSSLKDDSDWISLKNAVKAKTGFDPDKPLSDDKRITFDIATSLANAKNFRNDLNRLTEDDIVGMQKELLLVRQALEGPLVSKALFPDVRGLLMFGPAGTGKTVLAQVIFDILTKRLTEMYPEWFNPDTSTHNGKNLDAYPEFKGKGKEGKQTPVLFWEWNGADLKGPYGSNTESNIRKAFETAEKEAEANGPYAMSLVFLDEMETIASRRGSDASMNASVTSLLTAIDGVKKLKYTKIIAATNLVWALDDAILSRFPIKLFVDAPNLEARKDLIWFELWNYFFPPQVRRFAKLMKDHDITTGRDYDLDTDQKVAIYNNLVKLLWPDDDGTKQKQKPASVNKTEVIDIINQMNAKAGILPYGFKLKWADPASPITIPSVSSNGDEFKSFWKPFTSYNAFKSSQKMKEIVLAASYWPTNPITENNITELAKNFGRSTRSNDYLTVFNNQKVTDEVKTKHPDATPNAFSIWGFTNRDIRNWMQSMFFQNASSLFVSHRYYYPGPTASLLVACTLNADPNYKDANGNIVPTCQPDHLKTLVKGLFSDFNSGNASSSIDPDVYLEYYYYELFGKPKTIKSGGFGSSRGNFVHKPLLSNKLFL